MGINNRVAIHLRAFVNDVSTDTTAVLYLLYPRIEIESQRKRPYQQQNMMPAVAECTVDT